jgi:hypothetical protein
MLNGMYPWIVVLQAVIIILLGLNLVELLAS